MSHVEDFRKILVEDHSGDAHAASDHAARASGEANGGSSHQHFHAKRQHEIASQAHVKAANSHRDGSQYDHGLHMIHAEFHSKMAAHHEKEAKLGVG